MSRREDPGPKSTPGTPGQSPERREKRRQATLASRPWLRSTGPRTEAGKQRAAQNGRVRQTGEMSVRQLRAELAPFMGLARQMATTRDEIDRLLQRATGQGDC
jgi:hypothetical protein